MSLWILSPEERDEDNDVLFFAHTRAESVIFHSEKLAGHPQVNSLLAFHSAGECARARMPVNKWPPLFNQPFYRVFFGGEKGEMQSRERGIANIFLFYTVTRRGKKSRRLRFMCARASLISYTCRVVSSLFHRG